MRALAAFIMRGRSQAVLVVAISAALSLFLPPLSYISGAGAALITLRHGAREGLFVTFAAALILGLVGAVTLGNPSPGLAFLAAVGLPLWLLGWVLRATVSLPLTLSVAALLGVMLILGLHVLVPDLTVWWRGLLDIVLKPALEQSGVTDAAQWLDELARAMTALLASAMLLSWMLSLFIARWWQALLYNPGGFRREFHGLHLNRALAVPTLILLALALFVKGEIGVLAAEILAVMLVLYMMQGLALAHRTVAKRGAHVGWLVALYGLLTLALPQVGAVLAAMGFADTWLSARHAHGNQPKS
ncbi:MAG: hypothetical protein AB1469_06080 [Pseudomonadota bacterium]